MHTATTRQLILLRGWNNPAVRERASGHLIRHVERYSSCLRRVWPNYSFEYAPALVKNIRRLLQAGASLRRGAGLAIPREVLAVPVVAPFIIVIGIVVPQPLRWRSQYNEVWVQGEHVREIDQRALQPSHHGIHHPALPFEVVGPERLTLAACGEVAIKYEIDVNR